MKNEYIIISDRSIDAGRASLKVSHEISVFLAYHAFESIGGAVCHHFGMSYPHAHIRKINAFQSQCKNFGAMSSKIERSVAVVAVKISSYRNLALYPELTLVGVVSPSARFTETQAESLLNSVEGICRLLKSHL